MNKVRLLNAAIVFAAATILSVTTALAETITLKADLKGSKGRKAGLGGSPREGPESAP